MKLSASIMAHPDRTAAVAELGDQLGQVVPVAWDQEGSPSGNADRVWRNARRAWEMHDREADWHVLIQDDAIVCDDFLAGLERALEHVPLTAVVSPYLGSGRRVSSRWSAVTAAADAAGAVWVRTDRVAWGVCLVMPVRDIPEMIAWADRRGGIPDDMRVSGWARRERREVWYPWPSLSDHRPIPSLTKHRADDRLARKFLQGSALDVNWDGPVVTDRIMMRSNPVRSGPRARRPVRSVTTGRGPEG